MKRNGRFLAIGMSVTAAAVLAWSATQAMAQGGGGGAGGGGGSGSGTSGAGGTSGSASDTGGAAGSGSATAGAAQAQQSGAGAGAQSTAGQAGATGAAAGSTNQSGPNQATNNLLLESPGLPPQSTTGGQNPALRPFGGQGASQTNQPNQTNQNPANLSTGAGQDRSLLGGGTPLLAQRQRDALKTIGFRQGVERGLTIETLGPGSIFYDSGLRPGDVVVAIGNQPIGSQDEFERLVVSQWGQRIPTTVLRDGRQETVYVTFPQGMNGQVYGQTTQDQARPYQANRPIYPSTGRGFLGVGFDTGSFGMASVRDVLPDSAAEQAGLRQGDIIVSLNGQPVGSFREAMRIISSMQAGDSLEIEYTRRMPNRTSAVLGGRPTSGPAATGEQPIDESRFYRGDSQIEQQPLPQSEQAVPQTEQPLPPTEASPADQGQEFPPPSQPGAESERDDLP